MKARPSNETKVGHRTLRRILCTSPHTVFTLYLSWSPKLIHSLKAFCFDNNSFCQFQNKCISRDEFHESKWPQYKLWNRGLTKCISFWFEEKYISKLIYSEKATKFCEISTILRNLPRRFDHYYLGQIYGGDFAKLFGLVRIYELKQKIWFIVFFLVFIMINDNELS